MIEVEDDYDARFEKLEDKFEKRMEKILQACADAKDESIKTKKQNKTLQDENNKLSGIVKKVLLTIIIYNNHNFS